MGNITGYQERSVQADLPDGYALKSFATIDSTNTYAKLLADAGRVAAGMIIQADEQTAGRGRHGNAWTSKTGNLYASLILKPERTYDECANLGFVVSVALARVLVPLLGSDHDVRLKWPNDVLIDGRKISGILIETVARDHGEIVPDWVIIGTGVNIKNGPDGSTNLSDLGVQMDAITFLQQYIHAFDDAYKTWMMDGFEPIRNEWLTRASHLDQQIRVRTPKSTTYGIFRGIDGTGALLLEMDGGDIRHVTAGEVHFGREP